jgi:hemoglobin-like flavoprotein
MSPPNLIEESLALLAERHGDPTEAVYRRLFAQHPELEALFVLDRTGQARGNMLAHVFDTLIDIGGPRAYGFNMAEAERVNHEGLGVSNEVFASFFAVVMETVRELLADTWTPEMEAVWREAIGEIESRVHQTCGGVSAIERLRGRR